MIPSLLWMSMHSESTPTSSSKPLQKHLHRRTMSTSTRIAFPSISIPTLRSPPSTPPRRDRIASPTSGYRLINESPTNAALLRRTRHRKTGRRFVDRLGQWLDRRIGHGSITRSRFIMLVVCIVMIILLLFSNAFNSDKGLNRFAHKAPTENKSPSPTALRGSSLKQAQQPSEDVVNAKSTPSKAKQPVNDAQPARRPISGPQRVDIPKRPQPAQGWKGHYAHHDEHPNDEDEVPDETPEETTGESVDDATNDEDGPESDDPDEPSLEQELEAVVAAAAAVAASGVAPEVVEAKSYVDDDRKFVFAAWIGEQETKAQRHLFQLGLLAVALNRTLVLPQVSRSRFTTCYHSPFSLYYAPDTLDRFNIPWITHQDFLAYTHRDAHNQKGEVEARTGQIVAMVVGKPVPADMAILPLNNLCLAAIGLELDAYAPKAFFRAKTDWKDSAESARHARHVIEDLLKPDPNTGTTPDVLVFQYNLRYPLFSPEIIRPFQPRGSAKIPAYDYFDYSPHWTKLGRQIADNLSPFIAVHWRTETVHANRLQPCGSALIRTIKAAIAKRPELKTVYLAIDYPIEVWLKSGADAKSLTDVKIPAHSATMTKTLTPAHHVAMRAFLAEWTREFEDQDIQLTGFEREQKKVELSDDLKAMLGTERSKGKAGVEKLDAALVGIVDKNVLAQAEVFIAGSTPDMMDMSTYCAKRSQFTEQVIAGRAQILHAQTTSPSSHDAGRSLWNDVEHFKRPSTNGYKSNGRLGSKVGKNGRGTP